MRSVRKAGIEHWASELLGVQKAESGKEFCER